MEIVDKNIQANKASESCIGKKIYALVPFLWGHFHQSLHCLQAIFEVIEVVLEDYCIHKEGWIWTKNNILHLIGTIHTLELKYDLTPLIIKNSKSIGPGCLLRL